jgi:hypothetical protein
MLSCSSLHRNTSLPYNDTSFGTTPEFVPFWGKWMQRFNLRAISVREKNWEVRKEKRRGRNGWGMKIRDKRHAVNSNHPVLLLHQAQTVAVKCDRIGNMNLDVLRRGTAHARYPLRTLYRVYIVAPECRLSLPVGREFHGKPTNALEEERLWRKSYVWQIKCGLWQP